MDTEHTIEELRSMLSVLNRDSEFLFRYGNCVYSIDLISGLYPDDRKKLLHLALASGNSNIQEVAYYLMKCLQISKKDVEETTIETPVDNSATRPENNGEEISESGLSDINEQSKFTKEVNMAQDENMTANDWNIRGVDFGIRGQHEEAIACFDKALDMDKGLQIAWYNKGKALDNLDKPGEAIISYDNALEINKWHAEVWYDKGVILKKLGRLEEAIGAYDQALEIDPRLVRAWHNKGSILHDLGRFQESLSCMDKALEIDWLDAQTWYNKGIIQKKLGRYKEAIAALEKYLELAPPGSESSLKNINEYIKMLEKQS